MATVDELLKASESARQGTGTTESVSTPAPSLSTGISSGMSGEERINSINKIYDAQRAQREQELKSAYDQSLSSYQAAQDKIAPQYQSAANDLGTQYERNRLNFARQAAASGINTGTAAQESLARGSQYQRDFGALRTSESEAQAEAERKKADLLTAYQNNVAAALSENDYNRATALLNEANNQYQRDMQKAQALAQYGDFSGYATVYGEDAAKNMTKLWNFQNPDAAYNLGRISADEYYAITGAYPVGYTPPGYGGGGGPDLAGNPYTAYALGGWDPGNKLQTSKDVYVKALGGR